jgi:hypothetical protein
LNDILLLVQKAAQTENKKFEKNGG